MTSLVSKLLPACCLLVLAACSSSDGHAAFAPLAQAGAPPPAESAVAPGAAVASAPAAPPGGRPAGAAPVTTPAAPPPLAAGAPSALAAYSPSAGPTCEALSPKSLLDATIGAQTNVAAAAEPTAPGQQTLRCERQVTDIEQHFAYFVQCGKNARKTYNALAKQMKKMARKQGRGHAWRSAFVAPGTFAWLGPQRRCYGQVAGRLLLRRPELGERLAAMVAQNLRE